MSTTVFKLNAGDTKRVLYANLSQADGTALDVTDATAVTLIVTNPRTGERVIEREMTKEEDAGRVSYAFVEDDYEDLVAGEYHVRIEVVFADGQGQAPTGGVNRIVVYAAV